MTAANLEHPSLEQLAAHAGGRLADTEAERIARHLKQCPDCQALLAAVAESPPASLSCTPIQPLEGAPERPSTLDHKDASPSARADASFTLSAATEVPAGLASHPRYQVLERIGSGGMGVVYKARHRLMDRLVALKVIHPGLVERPGMVARFEREIKVAARLAHPNIVAAYDAGQSGDTHFFVMELVEGTDLEQVAARGRMPVTVACDYARQVARGLQHAHERGMVHRDIKPHNLMLTPEGRVKILDFGLARFVSETLPPVLPAGWGTVRARVHLGDTDPGALTPASGGLVGTADYMAPEEADKPYRADIRADLYSLGCTLYRFLTGRVPFPGGTLHDKVRAHRCRPPTSAGFLRLDLPAGLAGVLEGLMEKDLARRYQTPAEVVAALTPFVTAPSHDVLVVDDNPAVLESMRQVLEKEGYTVTVAENGLEALEKLRQGLRPEVILLDLMMPVMDGWQFLHQVRQDPQLSAIPTVLITAADPSLARDVALGAAGYLQKPVAPEQVASCVGRYASSA